MNNIRSSGTTMGTLTRSWKLPTCRVWSCRSSEKRTVWFWLRCTPSGTSAITPCRVSSLPTLTSLSSLMACLSAVWLISAPRESICASLARISFPKRSSLTTSLILSLWQKEVAVLIPKEWSRLGNNIQRNLVVGVLVLRVKYMNILTLCWTLLRIR